MYVVLECKCTLTQLPSKHGRLGTRYEKDGYVDWLPIISAVEMENGNKRESFCKNVTGL